MREEIFLYLQPKDDNIYTLSKHSLFKLQELHNLYELLVTIKFYLH